MKIAIVGGGICGLTSAYILSQEGHDVCVFEKQKTLGGLAGSFKDEKWQWPLENYYHHFFSSDKEAFSLLRELGLQDKLFFKSPKTSVFVQGNICAFDTPWAVLSFPYLSIPEKVRVGLITGWLKITPFWKPLEKIAAERWLKKYYGRKAYQMLWEPLLKTKFGDRYKEIPASWFWARIKKRTSRLGYLKGGLPTLTEGLAAKIKENKGKIVLDAEIKRLEDLNGFDKIIITTSPETFLKIASGLPEEYKEKIQKLESVGTIVLTLCLKEQFFKDGTYWLNINESSFPFVAVVNHTNFIDRKYYGGDHILYVGGYYPTNHPFFKMTKEQIYQKFLPFLKKINPDFSPPDGPIRSYMYADPYAQPLIPLNYSKILPSLATPLPNLFFASMHHVYPWDRGVNYAISLGRKVAHEISSQKD